MVPDSQMTQISESTGAIDCEACAMKAGSKLREEDSGSPGLILILIVLNLRS
jgi:hypothetical protein